MTMLRPLSETVEWEYAKSSTPHAYSLVSPMIESPSAENDFIEIPPMSYSRKPLKTLTKSFVPSDESLTFTCPYLESTQTCC